VPINAAALRNVRVHGRCLHALHTSRRSAARKLKRIDEITASFIAHLRMNLLPTAMWSDPNGFMPGVPDSPGQSEDIPRSLDEYAWLAE
jgi:hypothetical protein